MSSNEVSGSRGLESLKGLVRQSSLSRLKAYASFDDLEIGPVEGKPLVLAHWMSLVLISSKIFRMTFNVDFMSGNAKVLASRLYRKDPAEIEDAQAFDFIKEYCNLTAGSVKRVLEERKIKVGVSLPLLIRGFDRIYLRATESADTASDQWQIRNGETSVFCSMLLTVHDEEKFDELELSFEESKNEGKVRFL